MTRGCFCVILCHMKNDTVTQTITEAQVTQRKLNEINNNFNLTDEYVEHLDQAVTQLLANKERLNKALGILNKLPSSLEDKFVKVNPNQQERRW